MRLSFLALLLLGCINAPEGSRPVTDKEHLEILRTVVAFAQERDFSFPRTLHKPRIRECDGSTFEGRLSYYRDGFDYFVLFDVCGDAAEEDLAIGRHETLHEARRYWIAEPYYNGPGEEFWRRVGDLPANDWPDRRHADPELWWVSGGLGSLEARLTNE